MEDSHIEFIFFSILMFLAILVLIFVLLAVYAYFQASKVTNPIAPWGYVDWMCLDENNNPINMSDRTAFGKYGTVNMCAPITDGTINENGIQTKDTFTKFEYLNKSGIVVIGNPSQEKNIYDPDCTNDLTGLSCPNYEIGGIYWSACYGSKNNI